ncbi:hypothetical protein Ahy_B10g101709 [Arachis hypogaea]|uniref:At2g35280-like TPR domain-containing protein n=1 Tax=Arachis hypogaea TaxID=3818 RepID=A0A444X0A5_ARAHY|nr:hypothetical protein Ahy_B10g101709 [Arachis hypogaea]
MLMLKHFENEDAADTSFPPEGPPTEGGRAPARNPPRRNTKGNGANGGKKTQRCRLCQEVGHNRTTCPDRRTIESSSAVADDMDSMDTDMLYDNLSGDLYATAEILSFLCSDSDTQLGMETMHTVAAHGHSATQYTVSMMLMLRDDAEAKNKGLETFHGLEVAGALTICKLVFRDVIQGSWTHLRRVPVLYGENLVYVSHACPSRGNMGAIYHHQRYGRGWHVNDSDGGTAHVPCVHYRANYELILFIHLFD